MRQMRQDSNLKYNIYFLKIKISETEIEILGENVVVKAEFLAHWRKLHITVTSHTGNRPSVDSRRRRV